MAVERRSPEPGCIHHSDRGVQYACKDYVSFLKEKEFQISTGRVTPMTMRPWKAL